jgi:hypothetical protein
MSDMTARKRIEQLQYAESTASWIAFIESEIADWTEKVIRADERDYLLRYQGAVRALREVIRKVTPR